MDAARPLAGASPTTTAPAGKGGAAMRPAGAHVPARFAALLAAHGRPALRAGEEAKRPSASGTTASTTGTLRRREETDAEAHAKVRAREDGDADAGPRERRDSGDADAWLDPQARHLAQLAPPVVPFASTPAATGVDAPARARSLEDLVPELVRRIAWAGDGKRGTVRLELGAGAWAGANVVVHADGGRVRVELGGLDERELARLRERLAARLRGRGVDLEAIS